MFNFKWGNTDYFEGKIKHDGKIIYEHSASKDGYPY